MTPPDQGTDELEQILDKHTVALTSYTTTMPDGEPVTVTDHDTRVINIFEAKRDLDAHIRRATLEAQHTVIKNFEPLQRTHDTCPDVHSCIGYQNAASDFDNEKEILLTAISKELQEIDKGKV